MKLTEEQLARFMAKVDTNGPGGCWLWTASARTGRDGRAYGQFRMRPKTSFAHRIAFKHWRRDLLPGEQVDHRCANTLCVNPAHLRAVTAKQNQEHQTRLVSANTTGFRGVTYNKNNKKFQARVRHHGKTIHIGYFGTAAEAGAAAAAKRAELFTHDDHHNWTSPPTSTNPNDYTLDA